MSYDTVAKPTARSNAVDEADALDILRLRYWQHLLNEMLKLKRFTIPIHLEFGHEAAIVALYRSKEKEDAVCLTHRNAGYNLMGAGSLDAVLAHYRLEAKTPAGGLMGSMNLATEGSGIAYTSSILGNDMGVAAGMAMNRAMTKKPGVVFALTGDGAIEEGIFWESLLFARSHKLPLVIIVENNNHAMSSTIAQRRSPIDLHKIAAGLDVFYRDAAGASFADARRAIREARASAAAGMPALLELHVGTFNQHAGPTPGWPDDPLKIDMSLGMIVKHSQDDPVFLLQQELGEKEFDRLVGQIAKAEDRDKYLH